MNGLSTPSQAYVSSCPTTANKLPGAPIQRPVATQQIGNQLRSTPLLQDTNLIELIQSLDRERIPERYTSSLLTSWQPARS